MSRPSHVPSYRRHKQSGQAIVTLTDAAGDRRDVLLGRYGTKESRTEYARVIAEWEAAGRNLPTASAAADLTVNELLVRFWAHAEQHYRDPDGKPTNELNDYRLSLRPLRELYGHTPAKDFGPLALVAVRQRMMEAGLCRGVINQRVGRIRRAFKWAVAHELVPPSVLHGLQAVAGLQRGRSQARETRPVQPVPEDLVEATLPYLTPTVGDMVRLQLLAGMRPGEVCIMRACDLDMTGRVWLYRPGSDLEHGRHKTAYRGHKKVIAIGPRGQEVIKRHLKTDLRAYLFSPREAMEAFWAAQRKEGKRRPKPKMPTRRKPRRRPGEVYDVRAYAHAVRKAIQAANRAMLCDACREARKADPAAFRPCEECERRQLPHWHPHQLRHTKATEIRREAGIDAARAVLGHRSPVITEVYAELDMDKAAAIMERIG
jgi:integrase